MTYSCCAIKCTMLCYEFLLLSSHVKNSAANQRLQCEVSCSQCLLGQKGRRAEMDSKTTEFPRRKKIDRRRIPCIHTQVLMYFLLLFYKICINSTNFKITGPDCAVSEPLDLNEAGLLHNSISFSFWTLWGRTRTFSGLLSTVEGRNRLLLMKVKIFRNLCKVSCERH